jgi:tetratricopeptide (TPR) repeat protein
MALSDLGRTLVICRPDQLWEAGIVVSCLPGAQFTPLLILEPPPINELTHRQLERDLLAAMKRSMAQVTGYEYRSALQAIDQADEESIDRNIQSHWSLQRQLTKPRSWLKHNMRLEDLLRKGSFDRAVFLFAPTEDDLKLYPPIFDLPTDGTHPGASQELRDAVQRALLVPPDLPRVTFLDERSVRGEYSQVAGAVRVYRELSDLTMLAWQTLQSDRPFPEAVIVEKPDSASFLTRLALALDEERPLMLRHNGVPEALSPSRHGSSVENGEVVLVEDNGEAVGVLAALYARHRKAAFFVLPAPNLNLVQETIDAFNEDQEAEARLRLLVRQTNVLSGLADLSESERVRLKRILPSHCLQDGSFQPSSSDGPPDVAQRRNAQEPDSRGLSDLLRRYLLSDWQSEAIGRIQRAVTSHIPADTLVQVADRPVTVFTRGTPYNFVRTTFCDWTTKPIGHISADSSLVLLSEICRDESDRPPASFSLIFDPGFFATSETDDVRESLNLHFSHPIVLGRNAASAHTLGSIQSLPLDMIFFNTHGTDKGIVFGDFTLDNERLVQWVLFESQPIVFNNSCLSWTGVGREFIRVGARGYVGTLWSVNARSAADFGAAAMSRIAQGTPVSAAIKNSGVDTHTESAYIFVGTASASLDTARSAEKGQKAYCLAAVLYLLKLLMEDSRDTTSSMFKAGWEALLYSEVLFFVKRLETISHEPGEYLPLRIRQLQAMVYTHGSIGQTEDDEEQLFQEALRDAEQGSLDQAMRTGVISELYRLRSSLKAARGHVTAAAEALRQSESHVGSDSEPEAGRHLDAMRLHRSLGNWHEAQAEALKAKELLEKHGNREILLATIGELGQIAKRLSQMDDAIRYTREGYSLAVELGSTRERAAFKADEAQLSLGQGNIDQAEKGARISGELSRSIRDQRSDLRAHGLLTQCMIKKGDLAGAEAYAEAGIERARALEERFEEAGFGVDLADVAALRKRYETALDQYAEAASLCIEAGHLETVPSICKKMLDVVIESADWSLITRCVSQIVVYGVGLSDPTQTRILGQILLRLKDIIKIGKAHEIHDGLYKVYAFSAAVVLAKKSDVSDMVKLFQQALLMMLYWVEGAREEAERTSALLDQSTAGVFRFSDMTRNPPPVIPRFRRLLRKLSARWRSVKVN